MRGTCHWDDHDLQVAAYDEDQTLLASFTASWVGGTDIHNEGQLLDRLRSVLDPMDLRVQRFEPFIPWPDCRAGCFYFDRK